MGLLDAIDKLLEPITKRIFATKLGKSIRPLTVEELRKDDGGSRLIHSLSYADLSCNINYSTSHEDD